MESQTQNPEFRNNPETFTHVYGLVHEILVPNYMRTFL